MLVPSYIPLGVCPVSPIGFLLAYILLLTLNHLFFLMTNDAELFYMYFLTTSPNVHILFAFILFLLFVVSCEISFLCCVGVLGYWKHYLIVLHSMSILNHTYDFLDSNTFYLV